MTQKPSSLLNYFQKKSINQDSKDLNILKRKKSPIDLSSKKEQSESQTSVCEVLVSARKQYCPDKNNYDVEKDASWIKKEEVPYSALTQTLEAVENESKRLKIIEILTNFFRSVLYLSPDDLIYCLYLCLNKLAPSFEGIELGVGDSILLKAIQEITGKSSSGIQEDIEKYGDIGFVAATLCKKQKIFYKPNPMSVKTSLNNLRKIAALSGKSSSQKKIQLIKNGLMSCNSTSEMKFWIRALSGKMRIGLAEKTVLTSLGTALATTPPSQDIINVSPTQERIDKVVEIVKNCFNEMPSLDLLIPPIMKYPIDDLSDHCSLRPGIPIKPMLAFPTKCISQILERFEESQFTCEYKYDGERAQIHLDDCKNVFIFSRNQENTTNKYPDIISRIPNIYKHDSVQSFIIDCEVVAWDCLSNQIMPFQVLSTRKKKNVEKDLIAINVCLFVFDLLYFNGKPYHQVSLSERRKILSDNFFFKKGEFQQVQYLNSSDTDDIQLFLDQSIQDKCEGLMIKKLFESSSYQISKRSHNWLKLKADYLEGIGDTFDLVVVGATYGQGKRTGVYGNFLLACYDSLNEQYQTICKLGTGLSDEQLTEFSNELKKHIIDEPKMYYCYKGSNPNVWFEPVIVWEIKASDLSISPVYQAALGLIHSTKGISLRFPRFLRTRSDKKAEEATNSKQIAELYELQSNKKRDLEEFDE